MKVYQVNVCVRGNPNASAPVFVEAAEYKEAFVKALEGYGRHNNVQASELAVVGIHVIEEIPVKRDVPFYREVQLTKPTEGELEILRMEAASQLELDRKASEAL